MKHESACMKVVLCPGLFCLSCASERKFLSVLYKFVLYISTTSKLILRFKRSKRYRAIIATDFTPENNFNSVSPLRQAIIFKFCTTEKDNIKLW